MFHLSFPWPAPPAIREPGKTYSISLNHMYVWTGRGGQRRLSAFAEAWKAEVVHAIRESRQHLPAPPYRLRLSIYPPDRRRRDADGLVKLVQDACFEAFPGTDDFDVVELQVRRYPPERLAARIVVRIQSAPLAAPPEDAND